jgi:hypothetical protein
MKQSRTKTPQPRKLVLRREAIAQLTRTQLDRVAGGGDDGGCSAFRPQSCMHSNAIDASCVEAT